MPKELFMDSFDGYKKGYCVKLPGQIQKQDENGKDVKICLEWMKSMRVRF